MPYSNFTLPEYPCTRDIWDEIAEGDAPIAVYGMGNGADKLFARLERYGVIPAAVFASDGFVRGHSFRGYKVKTLSEVKAELGDNVTVLVSFASNRAEVIELIRKIDSENDLYIPDMPVAGDEYFDKDFYNAHYGEIVSAYGALADQASKNAYAALIRYKLTARAEYLFAAYSGIDDIYSLLPESISVCVDAGAYNGDTCRELMLYRPSVQTVYAIEPDARNYKRLVKYIDSAVTDTKIVPIKAAAWSSDTDGCFIGSGNRNSSVSSTASHENRREEVALLRIDSIGAERIDYIKYDVEGAELEALRGSYATVRRDKPALLVSVYHRSEDIFSLVNYLRREHPEYSLYMRRTLCFPAWETAVIAVLEKDRKV